jgi:small subunit ribosomal protein S4e
MARGPKKHMKRLNAPKHWMLAKMGGTWAPHPSAGPHKRRECLPLMIFLRNRLKYALTRREVTSICMQRFVKVDNKVRTDIRYPSGFMDVISIEKTNENFRLLYDTKGRFIVHRITPEEAKFKLCKVRNIAMGLKAIPYLTTYDGRTFRYPDPLVKAGDTVKVDLTSGKIDSHVKFESGALAMVTSGHNLGRVGIIEHKERHLGSFDIVHLKDTAGQKFATRSQNVFVIGKNDSLVTLPNQKGIRLSIIQERKARLTRGKRSGKGKKSAKAAKSAKPSESKGKKVGGGAKKTTQKKGKGKK